MKIANVSGKPHHARRSDAELRKRRPITAPKLHHATFLTLVGRRDGGVLT